MQIILKTHFNSTSMPVFIITIVSHLQSSWNRLRDISAAKSPTNNTLKMFNNVYLLVINAITGPNRQGRLIETFQRLTRSGILLGKKWTFQDNEDRCTILTVSGSYQPPDKLYVLWRTINGSLFQSVPHHKYLGFEPSKNLKRGIFMWLT